MKTIEISVLGCKEVGRKSWADNWQFQVMPHSEENSQRSFLAYIKLINSDCQLLLKIYERFSSNFMDDRDKQNLVRTSDFIFFMYDTTEIKTFQEIDQFIRKMPLHEVQCFLLGTKADLIQKRQVVIKEAEDLAAEYDMSFIEISSQDSLNMGLLWRILLIKIQFFFDITGLPATLPVRPLPSISPVVGSDISTSRVSDTSIEIEDNEDSIDLAALRIKSDHLSFIPKSDLMEGAIVMSQVSTTEQTSLMSPDPRRKIPRPTRALSDIISHRSSSPDIGIDRDTHPSSTSNHSILPNSQHTIQCQKSASPDSIRKFEYDKSGHVIPVVSTELRTYANRIPRSKNAYLTKEPDIYIDINLGDGRVGQIGVRSGDNVFELAKKFVETFNLHSSEIQHLAFLIRTQINRYVHKHEPNSSNDKLQTRSSPSDNQPILKLIVELGYGKSGTIAVRRGDDVKKLAKNFASTFGLKKWKENEIAEELKRQLLVSESMSDPITSSQQPSLTPRNKASNINATPNQTGKHAELLNLKSRLSTPRISEATQNEPRSTSSTADEGELLFNMEIEIKEGVKKSLAVRKCSDPTHLARVFAHQNKLKEKAEAKLATLINYHIQRFNERNSQLSSTLNK